MKRGNLILSASLAVCVLCSGAAGAAAQEQEQDQIEPTLALDEGGLNETVRKGAMISGSVVAGALVRAAEQDGTSLRGYIPVEWSSRQVCAHLTSIDGLYEALGNYSVPSTWDGGTASFDFPTKHATLLNSLPEDGLAIRVMLGQCGQAKGEDISVAFWNTSELSRVDLLLNSFRAESVFVYIANREPPIRCPPIDGSGRTAFDSKCTLDLDGLSGTVDLEVYRIVDGKPAPPDTVTIHVPEPEP